jgi:hypothetical protein
MTQIKCFGRNQIAIRLAPTDSRRFELEPMARRVVKYRVDGIITELLLVFPASERPRLAGLMEKKGVSNG